MIAVLGGGILALATAYALGSLALRRLSAPAPLMLAVGAIIQSAVIFLLLLVGAASPIAFALLSVFALGAWWRFGSRPVAEPAKPPVGRTTRVLLAAIFGAYGIFYFVHALAPEIQPDAVTYHLGLVAEYLRLGRFPHRVGFYEMVPQGMEMLFLHAFAFGRHSAAKLVHFGFLAATVPLLMHLGRRLALPDGVALPAAAFYVCAPVVGLTGTSTYNDAALVFFVLATLYALLAWRETDARGWLAVAGLTAGFCYAIKMSGLIALPAALLFVLIAGGRWRVAVVAGVGALVAAPWMLRNAVLAGNPFAPLFNAWFPNPYFHIFTEKVLSNGLSSYGGVALWRAPWELAWGGALQGRFGPLFLAVPLGLVALRSKAGRLCWLAAMVLALPWFANMGARFLLPALPFLWLALAMALPRPAVWACLAVQAVACWPPAFELYSDKPIWHLVGFPWRAALRIEPESQYLGDHLQEYHVARMIEAATHPDEKILALMPVAKAYLPREVLEYWHSAEADRLTDILKVAGVRARAALYDVKGAWPAAPLRGVRFRLTRASPEEWDLREIRLYSHDDRVFDSPGWTVTASSYPWELPFALDENLATRWQTWAPMRPGMMAEIDFDRPQVLTGATLISEKPSPRFPITFDGLGMDGRWRLLSSSGQAELREHEDLRRAASFTVRRAGYRYILAPTGTDGNGPLGTIMDEDVVGWGLRIAGRAGPYVLFQIP